jgi:hypothetical protein
MSILNILLKLSPALEQGESLANASTWTNVVQAKNAIITVLGFSLVIIKQLGYDLPISDYQLVELAGAVASIGAVVNGYFHVALNKEVGLKRH